MTRSAFLPLFSLLLSTSVALAACAAEDDAGLPSETPEEKGEAKRPADPTPGPETPEEEQPSVVVSHERELRAAWIATVYNIDWPSATGLSATAAKAELLTIFDALAGAKMNAVFLQVRSESDALYASTKEPWSRFLTGKQGEDPGWDPLTFAVEEGHKRGIEVHAWLNPYRGLVSKNITVAPNHVTKTIPSAARNYGTSLVWMDPGVPEVRTHILDVVDDIVSRYDVDGIHFDDYFYPYPTAGATFDDSVPYNAYKSGGGTLSKDDWRRSNVDALVRETNERVMQKRADVRFGVSPFGIYRPGTPAGITGLDAYATLYCDPLKWMNEGWVDYLAPQLYWTTQSTGQNFGKLVTWWASIAKPGRSVFVGHDATKVGESNWSIAEYDAQMKLVAGERANGARGSIFFSAKPLVTDKAGLRTALATKYWATPAATPPLATVMQESGLQPPTVRATDGTVKVSAPESTRSIAVYRKRDDGAFAIERVVGVVGTGAKELDLTLETGNWAVSRIDRRGLESRGVLVSVP